MTSELIPVFGLLAIGIGFIIVYRPVAIVIFFGLALPFGPQDLPVGLATVIFMSLLVIGVGLVVRLQRGLLPLPKTVASFSAILWTLGIVVGILISPNLMASLPFGLWQIVSALLAVYWAELAGRPTSFVPALVATLIGFLMTAASGVVMSSGSLESEFGGAVVTGRRTGVFAQPNEYGLFCLVVLVFTLGLLVATSGWLRVLVAVTTGVAGAGLMLSLSRGSWVGAIGGIVLLGLLLPQVRKGLIAATAAVVVVGSLVLVSPFQVPFLSVFVDRAVSIGEERTNPYDEREAYRAEGMREWNESPWVGQGPNSFPQLSDQIDSYARPGGAEHPHRFLLTIASEQGVIGLLAVFGFGVAVVLAVRFARPGVLAARTSDFQAQTVNGEASARQNRVVVKPSLPAVVVLCGAAALGGVFLAGLADFPMRNPLSRSVVFLVFGWVLAGERLLRWERWQRWQAEAASGPPSQRQVANG